MAEQCRDVPQVASYSDQSLPPAPLFPRRPLTVRETQSLPFTRWRLSPQLASVNTCFLRLAPNLSLGRSWPQEEKL